MEKYEKIEYDYIDSIGQWRTATIYELIEWDDQKPTLMDRALIVMEWALYALLTVPLLIAILLNLLNNY
jgi:hypothetical protein